MIRRATIWGTLALLLPPWTVLGASAAAQGSPGDEIKIEDPAGDVGVLENHPPQPLAANSATDPFDILHIRFFGEDADGLNLAVQVANLKQIAADAGTGMSGSFSVRFKHDASNIVYQFLWVVLPPSSEAPKTGVVPIPTQFCIMSRSNFQGGEACLQQRAIGSLDWDHSLLLGYMPKGSILGRDTVGAGIARAPGNLPGSIAIGSKLIEITARSRTDGRVFSDIVPNSGTAAAEVFVFRHPASNEVIQLSLASDRSSGGSSRDFNFQATVQDFRKVAVEPGASNRIPVLITNAAAGKRLLNLTVEKIEGAKASEFDFRLVPTLSVPGRDSRIANLYVNTSSSLQQLDSVLIRISSISLGFPGETGALKLRIVAATPPSPTARELYLHAPAPATVYPSPEPCRLPMAGFLCGGGFAWMNTLPDDPRATGDENGVPMWTRDQTIPGQDMIYARGFTLDTDLTTALAFSSQDEGTLAVRIQSDVPVEGDLTAELSAAEGNIYVASASQPVALTGSTPAALTIPFKINPEATRLPAGINFHLRVSLRVSALSAGAAAYLMRPLLVPQDSKLTLPIIEDPLAAEALFQAGGGAFIGLSVKNNQAEDFVNPGKSRLFTLTVVNEGAQEDVISLEGSVTPGWGHEFRPGASYRLKPGESATVGTLLRAPATAKEGERGLLALNATSTLDRAARATLHLSATVVTLPIPDDAENFTADAETQERLETGRPNGRNLPGFLGPAAIVALVCAVVAWRRR